MSTSHGNYKKVRAARIRAAKRKQRRLDARWHGKRVKIKTGR